MHKSMNLHPVGCLSVKYGDATNSSSPLKSSPLFSSPAVLPAGELWHLQCCDMDKQLPEMEGGKGRVREGGREEGKDG